MEKLNEDNVINVIGWKGKSETNLFERKNVYIVREYRKSKETGENYTNETEVSKAIVKELWNMILKNCVLGEEYKYRFLVSRWIDLKGIDKKYNVSKEIMMEMFNGGGYRKLEYFPFYYSLKVIEKFQGITYFGRGGIIRMLDYCEELER